jgi:hypothetical protein
MGVSISVNNQGIYVKSTLRPFLDKSANTSAADFSGRQLATLFSGNNYVRGLNNANSRAKQPSQNPPL